MVRARGWASRRLSQCHYVIDVAYHEDHCQVRDRTLDPAFLKATTHLIPNTFGA